MTYWTAPRATGSVHASVRLPGSKSLSARELLLSAVADTESVLQGVLRARDTDLMVAGLTALGARITPWPPGEDNTVTVTPIPGIWGARGSRAVICESNPEPPIQIDCGLSGTVMRFLPALAVVLGRPVRFVADAQANARPLLPLLEALEQWGSRWESEALQQGLFPFTIWPAVAGELPAEKAEIAVDATASSQFVSALLLAAPLAGKNCTVRSKTVVVPSLPHIQMTLESLSLRGINAQAHQEEDGTPYWTVEHASIWGQDFHIEPDLSNAGPFLAVAGIAGGSVSIPGWPRHTTQAGDAWRDILPDFGMNVTENCGVLTATGSGQLCAVDRDFSQVGELVPTAAALASFAEGTSFLRNLHHLRGHETDRLAALQTELGKLGIECELTARDDLVIHGVPRHSIPKRAFVQPVQMRSYADHRMATFAALLGLYWPIQIDEVACTSKTMPDFPGMWRQLIAGGTVSKGVKRGGADETA